MTGSGSGAAVTMRPRGHEGYFDYAATSPPLPEALDAYVSTASEYFGNPSSKHDRGMRARQALDDAKRRLIALLSADPDTRLILTSGGSESNNLVLNSFLRGQPDSRVLVAADVHESSWFCRDLFGDRVDVLKIDSDGQADPARLATYLGRQHCLVSIAHANNETGRVQDLDRIRQVCAEHGVPLHVDGVQAVGHVPLRLGNLSAVFYTFSGHKFGAARGIGGVLTGSAEMLAPVIRGGGQEAGLRSGTEDVAGIRSAAAALAVQTERMTETSARLREFAAYITERIGSEVPWARINSSADGLPGLVSISVKNLNGAIAVTEMAVAGYDLSRSSACHAGDSEPSRVMMALGMDRLTALGSLRISTGYLTQREDVEAMVATLIPILTRETRG